MSKRNRGKSEEMKGASWMDSFTDLLFLLVAFFVMLFSFSTIDAAAWRELVASFTGVIPVTQHTSLSPDVLLASPAQDILGIASWAGDPDDAGQDEGELALENFLQLQLMLEALLEDSNIDAAIDPYEEDLAIRLIFHDDDHRVFFDTNRAELRPEAYDVLNTLIDIFYQVEPFFTTILVEGHTDDRPPPPQDWRTNWNLSVARAVSVVDFFAIDGRLDETRLSATGYGEHRPIDTNDTYEGRQRNRRVEFLIETRAPRARSNG